MTHAKTRSIPLILPIAAAVLLVGAIIAGIAWSRGFGGSGVDAAEQRALASSLLAQGQHDQAIDVLEALRVASRGERLDDEGELLRIQALEAAGRHAELAAAAGAFLQDRNPGPLRDALEVTRLMAEVASAGLTRPDVVTSVEEFLRTHPEHPRTPELNLALARHQLALGDRASARRRLQAAETAAPADGDLRAAIRAELGNLNLEALLRGDPEIVSTVEYTVARGDSIWEIARKHNLTQELLMKANGIDDPSRLRVGQVLRVPKVDFALHCDVAANTLTLSNAGRFVKEYAVRTGREAGTTPEGTFRILNKKTGPTWRPGNGHVYLPGDPNNELGTRWMAFEGDILGIHGTIHPETVGAYASNGCIGLRTEDVEELFDLVEVGTPLTIKGRQDPTRHAIIPARNVPPPQVATR